MKTLALEFSTDQRSAAVLADGRLLGAAAAGEASQRATTAFALIEAALREAGTAREEIERIAVGIGPGSYAGIRVSIAVAQGWQLAREVRLLGVNSAHAIAARAFEEGARGALQVAIDAQRNEVYLAGFALEETAWRETQPLRLAPLAELESLARSGALIAGPDMGRWGSMGRVLFPHAKHVGILAADRNDYVSGDQLTPIYLRPVEFVKAKPLLFTGGG